MVAHKRRKRLLIASAPLLTLLLLLFLATVIAEFSAHTTQTSNDEEYPNCTELYPTQYICEDLEISPTTFELENCTPQNLAVTNCTVLDGVICQGDREFNKSVPCRYTKGRRLSVALCLSFFFGLLGIDRFYLGYVGLGIIKLLTVGFFGIGYWIDILMIAAQVLKPADGSNYIVGYTGPRAGRLAPDADTVYLY